jgi:polyisoprenyl-phosphate glycosyltransferase
MTQPGLIRTVTVLMPVYDDWETVATLLRRLDEELAARGIRAKVLLVDDGSIEAAPERVAHLRAIESLAILELRRNLGHQRALCVGLAHLQAAGLQGPLVVMDADGEDGPADVSRLLDEYARREGRVAVFAARAKRAERLAFRVLYRCYQLLHRLLVGQSVRVGNFSVLPPAFLDTLTVSSDLWNHYAATVFRAKLPVALLPVDRAQRIGGHSRMSLADLALHGLSAMSVYSDIIGVRMLFASAALIVLALLGFSGALLAGAQAGATFTQSAASSATLLAIVLLQLLLLSLVFCFVLLRGRSGTGFLPLRDCPYFVRGSREIPHD